MSTNMNAATSTTTRIGTTRTIAMNRTTNIAAITNTKPADERNF